MLQEKTKHDQIVTNDKHISLQRLLKAAEVAEILNISKSMAYRLMQTEEIPCVSIGNAKRVRLIDLERYVQQCLSKPDNFTT